MLIIVHILKFYYLLILEKQFHRNLIAVYFPVSGVRKLGKNRISEGGKWLIGRIWNNDINNDKNHFVLGNYKKYIMAFKKQCELKHEVIKKSQKTLYNEIKNNEYD